MSTRNTFLLFALLLAIAIIGLRSLGKDTPKEFRRSRILMDTVVEITVTDAGSAPLPEVVDKAFDEMARIEQLTSLFREGSDVARINAQRETEVSPETAAIVSLGLEVSRASGGAFDITLGRLKMLWPMDGTQKVVPSSEAIRTALVGSGMDAIALRNGHVCRHFAETMLDLGGIAKGYAIDRAYETLKAAGVRQAAVNAGGDLRLLGGHGEKPWRIAIQHPRKPGGIVGALALRDVAVVTSGDYERFFELDG
nr:FAD:protein FMN transferase [bacterium]